ncbi:MAG: DNA-directed RNA polymerase subunit N [Nanoarchaeota archaeon]|nr:DNA-directed RNA polymerase subunit N [Nanoarchaeota archaeon]MBU1135707.1 DNA-directed RNA polymerase subunit N [Nanoarchaeota archaeon]MBU2520501.1 DNA-directed RNA polymerase subunit N [Nanoarchaeota archaeon]
MIIPIRCMSCGKPVGHLWEQYQKDIKTGKNKKNVLDSLGLERYCCRALFMSHVDTLKDVARFRQ